MPIYIIELRQPDGSWAADDFIECGGKYGRGCFHYRIAYGIARHYRRQGRKVRIILNSKTIWSN